MIEKEAYAGQSSQSIEADLQRRGYSPLRITESPDTRLDPHNHSQTHIIVVTQGEMRLQLNGEAVRMLPGDQVTIPAHVRHGAYFGTQGCQYYWVEE